MWSWLNELLLSGGLFTPPAHGVTVCVKASAHLQKKNPEKSKTRRVWKITETSFVTWTVGFYVSYHHGT